VRQEPEKKVSEKMPSSGFDYLIAQINGLFCWLSEHSWAKSGVLIFVFLVYLNAFISVEKVPLGILSASIVAVFPILFAYLVFFILIFSAIILMPAAVFFSSEMRGEDGGLDEFIKQGRVVNIVCWCLIQIAICLAFIVIDRVFFDIVGCAFLASFLLVYTGASFLLARFMQPRPCLDFGFLGILFFSILFQMLVVVFIFARLFENSGELDYWELYFVAVSVSLLLALIQILVVVFLKKTLVRKDGLKRVVLSLFSLVFFLGLFPPTGAFLLGYVFQHASSGGRPCAVVFWVQESTPAEVIFWANDKKPGQSKPLRILLEVDGYYVARILDGKEIKDKPVEFIPRTLVARMDECPK